MFIRTIKSKGTGRHYVYKAESYRGADGVNRQRLLERIGILEEMEVEDPGVMGRLRAEAARANAERQARIVNVPADLDAPNDGLPPVNVGCQIAAAVLGQLGAVQAVRAATPGARVDAAKAFRLLVVGHIVFAGSKLRTIRRQGELFGVPGMSQDSVYRALKHIGRAQAEVQDAVHRNVTGKWGREATLAFYDVTNYHFTSDTEMSPRRKGCSKQHQTTPIVQMGLFMDSAGIPICYKLFDGNIPDCVTLEPILAEVKARFGLDRIVVVGDKAMNSQHNTYTLAQAGDGWIFYKSARGASKKAKKWLVDPAGWVTDPATGVRTKSKTEPRVVRDHDGNSRTVTEKIVARYSPVYAARDAHVRAKMAAKAEAMIKDPASWRASNKKGSKKYVREVKVDPSTGEIADADAPTLVLDQERLARDAELDGLYMVCTSETSLTDQEVSAKYHELWQIEENFRVSKTDLKARPVFVWTAESIEAHFLICFTALAVVRVLERATGGQMCPAGVLEAVRSTQAVSVGGGLFKMIRDGRVSELEEALGAEPFDRNWATIAAIRAHGRALTRAAK
ncbi:MAG: IS1634 family transposase [Bifidobacteriaceae bacterium]|jgi:hypothetical protein|nr:IS1634 family transposase [Bifidobacteriaceae bacterium]